MIWFIVGLPFYYAFITHTDLYYPQTGHGVHMINVPRSTFFPLNFYRKTEIFLVNFNFLV